MATINLAVGGENGLVIEAAEGAKQAAVNLSDLRKKGVTTANTKSIPLLFGDFFEGENSLSATTLNPIQKRPSREFQKHNQPASSIEQAGPSDASCTAVFLAAVSPAARLQFAAESNPIAERKLEDLMDYDEFYWGELDSRTQYCALILGYTPATWDEDFDLDDLICEDWDWDEMTKEQKAAAQHFGYTKETWSDCL
eukprot:CAMPEP_0116126614 /NCGR_PEP_ID=MMETSP0329-20121206/6422_1 /TAXON_ID=697910 /ORGANISM="Pseudo-nitzschia arenysensis, Strain B593" /LENGTH=196 /DNA_ID=CAMNT_0003620701 /DNA_START=273 /DNA_END=865 /DNA_ORIENTATION=+